MSENIFSTFQTVVHLSEDCRSTHVFVVMGASGDLAKKKIYPTLWWLYRDNLLPDSTYFLGYARSSIEIRQFLSEKCRQYMKIKADEEQKFQQFIEKNFYQVGSYDKSENFGQLDAKIVEIARMGKCENIEDANRIFYLALPPSVYTSVTKLLSDNCKARK